MDKENINIKEPDASIRAQFGKNHGFHVPDGYFNNLSSKIQDRIEATKEERKVSLAHLFFKPQFVAAYSIVLLIGLFVVFNPVLNNDTIENESTLNSELVTEQIMYVEDFDESAIIAAIDEGELTNEQILKNKAHSIMGGDEVLSDDEIISYLSDEELGELATYLP